MFMIRFENYKNLRVKNSHFLNKMSFNYRGAAVDQYDKQDFNLNDNGFIRNDICQLMRAQSQSEYDSKLRSLAELPDSSLPDNVTITDAIQFIQPRYSQSPAELAAYAESIGRFDLTKIEQMRASKKLPDVVEPESEPKSE